MTKSCASFFLRKKAAQDNKVKIKCLGRAYHDPTMRSMGDRKRIWWKKNNAGPLGEKVASQFFLKHAIPLGEAS